MEKQITPTISSRFTKETGEAMTDKPEHPTTEQIYQYAEGSLSQDSELVIESHFSICSRCVEELELAYDFVAAVAEAEGQPIEIPAVTPGLISRLANLLSDLNPLTQIVAAQSLGNIGAAAATPAVFSGLNAMLSSDDDEARQAARDALKAIRPIREQAIAWVTTALPVGVSQAVEDFMTNFRVLLHSVPDMIQPLLKPQGGSPTLKEPLTRQKDNCLFELRFEDDNTALGKILIANVYCTSLEMTNELIGTSSKIRVSDKASHWHQEVTFTFKEVWLETTQINGWVAGGHFRVICPKHVKLDDLELS